MTNERIDIHTYFLLLAKVASLRATCPRRAVGTVLVREGKVVSTGYNGSLPGRPHCTDAECLIHKGRCIRTVHSEANAVAKAREQADTAYCTDYPCIGCLKSLLAHGVKHIYYERDDYRDVSRDLFVAYHALEGIFTQIPMDHIILEVTD